MRFEKGTSGNPAGKRPGTRHRATQAAERLLDGETDALTRKAVDLALAGDTVALRLCLERILPPRRSRSIRLQIGEVRTLADLATVQATIITALARGEITPDEAANVANAVEKLGAAWERRELEQRICSLEQQVERAVPASRE
jgi:hypothetical protein